MFPNPPSLTNPITSSSTPNLRIEGPSTTIFEGPITSGPRNLTATVSDAGSYTFPCDGDAAEGINPHPFNTALDALDQASKTSPTFKYTLGYDGDLEDFYITELAGYGFDTAPSGTDASWGLLYNWQLTTYGDGYTISGCRQQVATGSDVLWAYGQDETTGVFLRVEPATVTVKKGASVTFTITNGLGGKPRPSATIHGVQANAMGRVVVPFPTAGYQTFKAKESGAVRSQLVKITVTS